MAYVPFGKIQSSWSLLKLTDRQTAMTQNGIMLHYLSCWGASDVSMKDQSLYHLPHGQVLADYLNMAVLCSNAYQQTNQMYALTVVGRISRVAMPSVPTVIGSSVASMALRSHLVFIDLKICTTPSARVLDSLTA